MKKLNDFADRRQTALAAKAALLEKFKARPAADDPEVVARAEARRLAAEAKAAAKAQRELEEQARREELDAAAAAKLEADAAEAKAARDARYAARKLRKQG